MMANDWFRNTTWNDEIAAAFQAKLGRARPANRQQYLRIQDSHISKFDPRIALSLLDQFFSLGDDRTEMASAWLQRAQCFAQLALADEAVRCALEAVEWERKVPSVITQVSVWLPLYIAENNLAYLFDTATELLSSRRNVFPSEVFHHSAALALIADFRKEPDASAWATKALEAANMTDSGFAHHPRVGLVGKEDRSLVEKMRLLASK